MFSLEVHFNVLSRGGLSLASLTVVVHLPTLVVLVALKDQIRVRRHVTRMANTEATERKTTTGRCEE